MKNNIQICDHIILSKSKKKFSIPNFRYRGFHEKGTLSYLCALGIDRCSPSNECTLQVPFIWNQLYAQQYQIFYKHSSPSTKECEGGGCIILCIPIDLLWSTSSCMPVACTHRSCTKFPPLPPLPPKHKSNTFLKWRNTQIFFF